MLIFLIADVFFARSFSKTQFAVWKQINLIRVLIVPMIAFGFPEGFKYYLALEADKKQLHLSIIFNILCLITLFLFIIAFFKGAAILQYFFPNSSISSLALYFPFIFLFFTLNKVFRYVVINEGLTRQLLIGSVAALLVGIFFVAFTLYAYRHFHWYLVLSGLMIIICYLISFVNILMKLPYKIHFRLDFNYLKHYLKIGFPLYLASFIGIIVVNLDTAIVLRKDTVENFAVYSVGALEIPLFSMISASVSQSYFPKMVALLKLGNKKAARTIWLDTTVKTSFITYPIILALMAFASPLLTTFFGDRYIGAVPIFKTYLLVTLWRNNYYGAIISASGRTKWIFFYSSLNLLLNLILAIVLFNHYGMYGVAFSAFLSSSFMNIMQLQHEDILLDYTKMVLGNPLILIMILLIAIAYFIT
ncbi:MAG TPA: oligosaccharide flippase family protein [Flavisolibacter sp.]|nr:oligosaccharide flippase family protein [Flavisolibacter sp.]